MRSCIFCERRATSKEHAWPMWLMQRIGATEGGRVEAQRGRQAPMTWRAGNASLTVRCVCASCNSGWMSDLENRVKPIVERLFTEQPVALDRYDQTTLAVWAGKNAMVYETLRLDSPHFFSSLDRKTLGETMSLPPHTSVWLAKCVGDAVIFCSASELGGFADASGEEVRAYVTTMSFGPLAIQVVCGQLPDSFPRSVRVTASMRPGPWHELTLPIWPIQSEQVAWPASVGLSGELGLDAFSKRWGPVNL